jgi:hypothetical protein
MKHYIDLIQDSEELDPETKLKALCDIDLVQSSGKALYYPKANYLAAAFVWNETENGCDFWRRINDLLYPISL